MKKIAYLAMILGLIALPSSVVGVNELTEFLTPYTLNDYICITGIKENLYKNCEYKFQFELPTDRWNISDKYETTLKGLPFMAEPPDYWVSFLSTVDVNEKKSAGYGHIMIVPLNDKMKTFEEYDELTKRTMEYVNYMTLLEYYSDSEMIETLFIRTFDDSSETFMCISFHRLVDSIIYAIKTCGNNDTIHMKLIEKDINNFWKSFKFL